MTAEEEPIMSNKMPVPPMTPTEKRSAWLAGVSGVLMDAANGRTPSASVAQDCLIVMRDRNFLKILAQPSLADRLMFRLRNPSR